MMAVAAWQQIQQWKCKKKRIDTLYIQYNIIDITTQEPNVIMRMDWKDILLVIEAGAAELWEEEALGDDALDIWEAVWILIPVGPDTEALWEAD